MVLGIDALGLLVRRLAERGYRVLGPTLGDGAIVYDELRSADDLPIGWTEDQDAGRYRLRRRDDDARFGYALGPHSWKRELFPPRVRLFEARRTDKGFDVEEERPDGPPLALLGVRPCELRAIAIQDRVFLRDGHGDGDYAARRANLFVVAVNCSEPGGTCFCVSTGSGPRAESAYDLALTELLEEEHRFLVDVGSVRGAELLGTLPARPATDDDRAAAAASIAAAAERMGRTMDTRDLRGMLLANLEHPRWEEIAERCLSCGNCTLVCPTCFCSTVEDTGDLTGAGAERRRVWDTCFSVEHSYIHGGSVRPSVRSMYRQWLTHKLATWHDQFGSSGCVGCGRCITWCPAAIDITAEVAALRAPGEDHAARA